MKNALTFAAFTLALFILGIFLGIRHGKGHPTEPPVCVSICSPYTEAARLSEDAAQRCDRALLTCLSYQGVMQGEIAEMQVAFVNFKNAITGCVQQ